MQPSGTYPALHLAAGLIACVLAVGICVRHRLRSPSRSSDYLIGAVAWVVAVAAKVALALLVFGALRRVFGEELPLRVSIPTTGLLTGLTECVLLLLLARASRWRAAHWDSQVALGLGFGCFEALALGIPMVLGALAGFVPEWLDPAVAGPLQAALSDPLRPLTFLFERAIAVPVHVLACVLVLRSVAAGRPALFGWGFLLKSAIDAVPSHVIPEFALQLIYGAFGIGSALVLLRLGRSWRTEPAPRA